MDYEAHAQAMLAHFLKWMTQYPEYIGKHAIPAYFKRCPWAEPLIGPQLREAWRTTLPAATESPVSQAAPGRSPKSAKTAAAAPTPAKDRTLPA